jgi:hypothetical protein
MNEQENTGGEPGCQRTISREQAEHLATDLSKENVPRRLYFPALQ